MNKNEHKTVFNVVNKLNKTFINKYGHDWLKNYSNNNEDIPIDYMYEFPDKIESYLKLLGIMQTYFLQDQTKELVNILVNYDEDDSCVSDELMNRLAVILSSISKKDKLDLIVEISILEENCTIELLIMNIKSILKKQLRGK